MVFSMEQDPYVFAWIRIRIKWYGPATLLANI